MTGQEKFEALNKYEEIMSNCIMSPTPENWVEMTKFVAGLIKDAPLQLEIEK